MRLITDRLDAPVLGEGEARSRIEELLLRREEGRTSKEVRGSALDQLSSAARIPNSVAGREASALRALASEPMAPRLERLEGCPWMSVPPARMPWPRSCRHSGEGRDAMDDPAVRYLRPAADRVLLCHQDGAQARVALLCPGDPLPEAKDAARRIWHEILGGAASLLFQEIREARILRTAREVRWNADGGRRTTPSCGPSRSAMDDAPWRSPR